MPILAIFSGLLLILGLLNPVHGNLAAYILGFAVFGFTSGIILGFWSLLSLVCGLIVAAVVLGASPMVIGGGLGGWVLARALVRLRLTAVAVLVLVAVFWATSFVTNGDLLKFLSRDLPLYTYNNDAGVIYKTYLLLAQDFNYYDAYRTAQLGRFAQPLVPGDIWGWRLPTLFLIWDVLPGSGGIPIYLLFLLGAAGTLVVAYLLAKRYLGQKLGLLAPYLVFPYFSFGARDQMIMATEWWAVMPFIAGVFFLVSRRSFWAIIFLTLTVLIREVYVVPIGVLLLWALFKKREAVGIFVIPLLAFLLLYVFHVSWVSGYIDAWGTLMMPRVVDSGWFFIQQTLSFASWEYLLFRLRPFLWFLVMATLGTVWLFARVKKREEAMILLLSFLPFIFFFWRFGTVPYNDYWGIIYVPQVIILAPLALLVAGGGEQSHYVESDSTSRGKPGK